MNEPSTAGLSNQILLSLNKLWWLLLVRGIFALLFGIVAVFFTRQAAAALVIAFGIYLVVDGLILLVATFRNRRSFSGYGLVILQGAFSMLAGVALLLIPKGVTFTVVGLFVVWAVVLIALGVGLIGLRLTLVAKKAGTPTGWSMVANICTLGFGVLLAVLAILNPSSVVLGFLWFLGIWAALFGVLLLIGAFSAKKAAQRGATRAGTAGGRSPDLVIQLGPDGKPLG